MPRSAPDRDVLLSSITFDEYVHTGGRDARALQTSYRGAVIGAAERTLLHRIDEPLDVLVIQADQRGSADAGVAFIARVADETGAIRLRILTRERDNARAFTRARDAGRFT
jgi:hypothetical protein